MAARSTWTGGPAAGSGARVGGVKLMIALLGLGWRDCRVLDRRVPSAGPCSPFRLPCLSVRDSMAVARESASVAPPSGNGGSMSADPLADVLTSVRLTGSVFYRVECAPPWVAEAPASSAIADQVMPGIDHVIEFHAVARGRCLAGIVGEAPVELEA